MNSSFLINQYLKSLPNLTHQLEFQTVNRHLLRELNRLAHIFVRNRGNVGSEPVVRGTTGCAATGDRDTGIKINKV